MFPSGSASVSSLRGQSVSVPSPAARRGGSRTPQRQVVFADNNCLFFWVCVVEGKRIHDCLSPPSLISQHLKSPKFEPRSSWILTILAKSPFHTVGQRQTPASARCLPVLDLQRHHRAGGLHIVRCLETRRAEPSRTTHAIRPLATALSLSAVFQLNAILQRRFPNHLLARLRCSFYYGAGTGQTNSLYCERFVHAPTE